MTRKETAKENFLKGYNCAQSLTLAFADLIPVEREDLLKMSCSFGGGMGRLREVCGAVSGMFMLVGFLYGYHTPETGDIKKEHYARVQELAGNFEKAYGSIICRDLLGLTVHRDDPTPDARTAEYYDKRPCPDIVAAAAEILEEYIANNPISPKND